MRRLRPSNAPRTLLYATSAGEFFPAHHARTLAEALSAARLPHVLLDLPMLPHAAEGGETGVASQLVRAAIAHVLTAGA